MAISEKPGGHLVNPIHKDDQELAAELEQNVKPKSGQKINATNGKQLTVEFVEGIVVHTVETPTYPIPLANLRSHPTKPNEWIVDSKK